MDFKKNKWKPLYLRKEGIEEIITVPVHKNEDLKKGLLKAIIKVAGIKESEL